MKLIKYDIGFYPTSRHYWSLLPRWQYHQSWKDFHVWWLCFTLIISWGGEKLLSWREVLKESKELEDGLQQVRMETSRDMQSLQSRGRSSELSK